MPTRIVFREPQALQSPATPERLSNKNTTLKSSILNLSTRNLVRKSSLSYKDTAASPRLTGYLFTFTAYTVLLVSCVKYEKPNQEIETRSSYATKPDDNNDIYQVSEWKRDWATWGSASLVGAVVVIILAHFDTVFRPNWWRMIFRDESKIEAALILFLIAAASFMVFLSTSSRGIGGFVGYNYNVYLSSWLGLVACVYTFQIWLQGTQPRTMFEILTKFRNKTTSNWAYTFFFSLITLLSLLDIFSSSGGAPQWRKRTQLTMIIAASSSMFCCLLALVIHRWCDPHRSTITTTSHQQLQEENIRPMNLIEGLLAFIVAAFWIFVVFGFTGVNGLVNGPSNAYFGAWGSCFCSILTIGSWLKEHHNFELS